MSLGGRIRRLRQARGYSLDELVERMGGAVTKQALSKYEHDRAVPRPTVLVALARALSVKAAQLLAEPPYTFEVVAYRALAALPKREQASIEGRVVVELESRLRLLDRLGVEPSNPFASRIPVREVADAERAAEELRSSWRLGAAPIANVADSLEDKGVFLIEVATDRKFDGIAIRALDDDGEVAACGVATRREVKRARQRMDHAHETAHLALDVRAGVDEEAVAMRFGRAFLFPKDAVIAEFGERRNRITTDELLLAKRRWGLSIQAILFRLKDLEVINDSSYRWWCMRVNQMGWKHDEPGDEPPERSTWVATHARRAAAEGLISRETLAEYLPSAREERYPGDIDRRALMKLPLEERRAVMRAQAEAIAEEYNAALDDEWMSGDFEDE